MASPSSPKDWQEIRQQLGPAYDQFDERERARHVELLQRVERPDQVEVWAERTNGPVWTVTVCTSDHVGVLSVIAGMFTAHVIDVVGGDIFTLRFGGVSGRAAVRRRGQGRSRWRQRPPAPVRSKILDIFRVRTAERADLEFWRAFRDELARLVALLVAGDADLARQQVIERVSEAARSTSELQSPLFPVTAQVDNESSPDFTELTISAADTLGFLFEFTNALAMLNVNIERVEVRTRAGEVRDRFWVTDAAGRKITDRRRLEQLRVAAALIKQFTHLLPQCPNPAQALRQFHALAGQMLRRPDWLASLQSLESDQVLRTLAELMGVSQFLWEDFLRMQHENLFPVVQDVPALSRGKSKEGLRAELAGQLADLADYTQKAERLNQFKDREMFRIDLRHITGRIGFEQFAAELSDLAEVVVEQVAQVAHELPRQRFGTPRLGDGSPCPWCVCALGKFGGRELGFASDIELLFVYRGAGTTDGGEPVENAHYFPEYVTAFLQTLRSRREGIFQIDLRLRPYGRGGSLACSLDGFRKYFSDAGGAEQFERMALVKLRPVAGDQPLAQAILQARDAFVYSGKPLDYHNLLHLRQRQASELVPTGARSAKYSRGGVVDVEYFVQARQIEAGAEDPFVRVTNTLEAVRRLAQHGHLDAELAGRLGHTYSFLRRLIDALRVVRGHAKDLTIPPATSRPFAYLARRLSYPSPEQLAAEISAQMQFAAGLWDNLETRG